MGRNDADRDEADETNAANRSRARQGSQRREVLHMEDQNPAGIETDASSDEELYAQAYEAFAYVLLNEPDEQVLHVMQALLTSSGRALPEGDHAELLSQMKNWFQARLEAPGSPSALPLWEEAVLGGARVGARFGQFSGKRTAQVKRAFLEHGFDEKGLSGSPVLTAALHADSLATEAAFMAHLHRRAAQNVKGAAQAAQFFARKHLAHWAHEAAALVDDNPVYRSVIEALADLANEDAGLA